MPQFHAPGVAKSIMCDLCRCAEYAHVLPAEAYIEQLSPSSQDAQNHGESSQPWNGTLHDNTEIFSQVALRPRSEANKYTQAQRNAYERKLGDLRKNIFTYSSTCDTSTLNKYQFYLIAIWKLFLELDAAGMDKTENEDMLGLVRDITSLNQQIDVDFYTRIFMAAYWAFFVRYRQKTGDKTIPVFFFYSCLENKGKTEKDQMLILRKISEYRKSRDLSSNLQAGAANDNLLNINLIFKIVQMLQLYQYLYDFCTAKYESWDELQQVWQNLIRAHAAYDREPLKLNFNEYLLENHRKDMLQAVGKPLKVQEVGEILKEKSLCLAVQKIGLQELLSVRKSKIRNEKLYKVLVQVFHQQQRWTALNRVSTELTAISAYTKQDADEKIEVLIDLYELNLSNTVDGMLTHLEEIQALEKLCKRVDVLINGDVHTAPSRVFPKRWLRSIFHRRTKTSNMPATNTDTMKEQVSSETGSDSRAASTSQAKENNEDENITMFELLELIYKFCILEKTSVSALEKLWVKITEKYKALERSSHLVGYFFNQAHAKLHVDPDGINRFCAAVTFKEAVQHIGPKQLVDRAKGRPTENQSRLIADAYGCKLKLDELSLFCVHLKETDIDTKGKSYAVVQDTASTLEAELDKALGQLREEREVLPRLLEELQELQRLKP
tara:strand:+ start:218 stop:2212 length:1995 start_codon:yes stop_codon:yes gene_type:complete